MLNLKKMRGEFEVLQMNLSYVEIYIGVDHLYLKVHYWLEANLCCT